MAVEAAAVGSLVAVAVIGGAVRMEAGAGGGVGPGAGPEAGRMRDSAPIARWEAGKTAATWERSAPCFKVHPPVHTMSI